MSVSLSLYIYLHNSEWVDGIKVSGQALVNLQQQRAQLIQDDQADYGALSDIFDGLDDYTIL